MTKSEIAVIRNALQILHRLVSDDEPHAVNSPSRCPVIRFIKRHVIRQPGNDLTTAELWGFYSELAASGEVEILTKQEFLRALPGAMAAVLGVKKCHSIRCDQQTRRGFKTVTFKTDACPVTTLELEPE